MRKTDTSDVLTSLLGVIVDAAAIFAAFAAATWIRFDSGWVPVVKGRPENLYIMYLTGAGIATLLYLFIYRSLGLYVRPQIGSFGSRIPRLIRGTAIGTLLTTAVAFAIKTEPPFSTAAVALGAVIVAIFVAIERYVLFQAEKHIARHHPVVNRVLVLGTDEVAVHLRRVLEREPALRCRVTGFLSTGSAAPDPGVPPDLIKGHADELSALAERGEPIDQIILTDGSLGHSRIVDLILFCEKNLITFNMVPDLFRILTGGMDVQTLDDIPLLGVSRLPLDFFWNRVLKRTADILGASVGIVLAAPVVGVAAVAIKATSPGPVFFRQERCGRNGKPFILYKLRTMAADAEASTGPVFAKENDPRTTKVGAFLRRYNLDELPQFWNVLKGDMSLVGPRPERPHFVEKFRDDVSRYMWRHVSKPGLTGWAQVNGLRGNTSIDERIKYDLYYLEKWSLALDFKILLKTFFARRNAY